VAFDLARVEVAYGGVVVCREGVAVEHDEKAVRAHMQSRSIEMRCDLGLGGGSGAMLSTDLGHGYIDENRTTS
jgi:glutamate N-acetyltransferase/amino-acid N-acetyltransferase